MNSSLISKSDQYALIAFIAKELGGADRRLGKKALQKNIHLIQELGGVDAGYRFSFYTYGPYSSELAGDLDVVAALEGVKVSYNSADSYYLIEPSVKADRMIEKGRPFIETHRNAIDSVLRAFGSRKAKELELVSTIAYLRRHAPGGEFDDDAKLVARVKALKPKYNDREIAKAVEEVKGFLATREAA